MFYKILLPTGNEYTKTIESYTDLHVVQEKKILEAYHNRGPLELFYIFLPKQFLQKGQKHEQIILEKKGILEASITDILGMIGLELGISLCKLNTIKDYLSTEPFGSSTTFRKTMSNDRFLKLRVNLSFYRDRN